MDYKAYLGHHCLLYFFVAVLLDTAGLILFFIGIFAPLSSWDFYVISGPIVIFFSLVFWIFWYLGNLEVPVEEVFD
ncbi:Transmembrane protein 238 [Collichthys lucidus]|uniref:Transmembrane protein 238 n=1 Tax=Collichthys lucidus TaxID=240159 RepID=A0A4U5VQJ8_COLLU|nr:Transmembrane protein 238 [Collichthys lucidus]